MENKNLNNIENWLDKNTYDYSIFSDLDFIESELRKKNLKVSVIIPTLEEESTIENILNIVLEKLYEKNKIVHEIIVIDGGSEDKTLEICNKYKDYIKIFDQKEIHCEINNGGKGEALWKSLFVCEGDIVVYIDSDIKDFTERFIVGIIGPMLVNNEIKFVKGYYNRPLINSENIKSNEGGRVTELCARPLLNLLYPDLGGFVQPLGGEYGGYKNILENIKFTSGYGVEVQLLIEIYKKYGIESMGQTNLYERIHRHQPINSLSKMSSAIMKTILKKWINEESLNNSILIKNILKENNEFVKARSSNHLHCNCEGKNIDDNFKYVEIKESELSEYSSLK